MKKCIFVCALIVALLFTNAALFSVAAEPELEQQYITVESYGTFYSQRAYVDGNGTVFVPVTMLAQFGRLRYSESSAGYTFYRNSETSKSTGTRDFLAGARTITINKSGTSATVFCYTSKNVAKTVSSVNFSKAHTIDKKLYLPLTECLPLLDAKVEITKDGVIHIYANPISAFYALYSGNIDLCVFDASKMIGGGLISASGLVVDSILNFRFDRLDVMTNSGAIKDYSSLFKKLLTDNETYLSAFDKEETPIDKYMDVIDSEVGDFADKANGVKDLVKAYEYLFSSTKHSTYKEFSKTAGSELHKGVDLISAADKIISFADRYTKQVEDHRNMLNAVYGGGSKPAAVAANEVYTLYGKNTTEQITSAATLELRSYLSKIFSGAVSSAAGLKPYKIAFDAVQFLLPEMTDTWSDAAELYFIANVVNDSYNVATNYENNPKFDEASLERQRLALIMMLISSKYGYETFYGEEHDSINAINAWLEKLYLAADSVECVSSGYYSATKTELQKTCRYIVSQNNSSPDDDSSSDNASTSDSDTSSNDNDSSNDISPDTNLHKCGNNVTWSLKNGVLTISGFGKMYDFDSISDQPWCVERKSITSIIIKNGVTSIGDYAFRDCANLTNVTIANSVITIGERAFNDCYKLVNVNIPNGVSSIEKLAFSNCSSLTNITIPDSINTISDFMFRGCEKLNRVTIPKSVTSIGSYAFHDCTGLEDVYYGSVESDWQKIIIGNNNAPLTTATIYFSDGSSPSEDVSDCVMEAKLSTTYVFENTGKSDSAVTVLGSVEHNVRADWIILSSNGDVKSHANYGFICFLDDVKYTLHPGEKMIVALHLNTRAIDKTVFQYDANIAASTSSKAPITRYQLNKNECYSISNTTRDIQTFYFSGDINCGEFASANARADYVLEDGAYNILKIDNNAYVSYLKNVPIILNPQEKYLLRPRSDYSSNEYIIVYSLNYGNSGTLQVLKSNTAPVRQLNLQIGCTYTLVNDTEVEIPLYVTGSNVKVNYIVYEDEKEIKNNNNYYLSYTKTSKHVLKSRQSWIITPLSGATEGNSIVIFVPYSVDENDLIFTETISSSNINTNLVDIVKD